MGSYGFGKTEVCNWIKNYFPKDSEILDVGACDGIWKDLLPEYPNMDAVEIFAPHLPRLIPKYRKAYCCDIADFKYRYYDLIIFGDVIEHMNISKAQKVLTYAKNHCTDMIIAVPFLYPQGEIYGNKYERHIQDDLTPEVFEDRYGTYELLYQITGYAYYHKRRFK